MALVLYQSHPSGAIFSMTKYMKTVSPSLQKKLREASVPWGPLGWVTYRRTYSRKTPSGLENWGNTICRGLQALLDYGMAVSEEELESMAEHWHQLRLMPAGRGLWQLGTSTVTRNGSASLQNCYFLPINCTESFCFLFEMLMLGGGVGFSVMPNEVFKLPNVKQHVNIVRKDFADVDFIVPDNREGWVELLRKVLTAFFVTGKSFAYSCQAIRSKGALIQGFGGVASGPEDLAKGIWQITHILMGRAGKSLRPIDALDICNIIGSVVVAGNVRRSAQIALGYSQDVAYLDAKNWGKGNIPNWRSMSNNTVIADDIPELPDTFWGGYNGEGEPYGLFNLGLSRSIGRIIDNKKYPDPTVNGVNPCFAGETLIATSKGAFPIRDLVGKEVEIHDGKQWRKVNNFRVTGENQPVLKVTLHDGSFLRITPYHTMILKDGSRVEAKDLKEGNVLMPVAEGVSYDGTVFSPGAYLKGFLMGDGTLNAKGIPQLWVYSPKYACLDRLKQSAEEINNTEVNTNAIEEVYFLDEHDCTRKRMSGLACRKQELDKWATTTEDLPLEAFQWDRKTKLDFIAGLMDADGTALDTKNGFGYQLVSVSRSFLLGVQSLLKSMGIWTRLSLSREAAVRTIKGREYSCKTTYRLCINQKDAVNLSRQVEFSRLKSFKDRTPAYNTRDRSTKVISIQMDGIEDKVYCCTVEETHAFTTASFVQTGNCAEQTLADWECCCLVETILPNIKDTAQFHEVAMMNYRIAKTIISVPHHWPQAQAVIEQNRRIGVGITGICQQTRFGPNEYDSVYKHMREEDISYSRLVGIRPSVKLTTVKPSGTTSLLPGVTPGVHPAYSPYYIRRIRMASDDPLLKTCRSHGYHVEPVVRFDGSQDSGTSVVSFPVKPPKHAVYAAQMTAIDQLELQKKIQTYWSDNAVSITCYYRKEELPAIKDWLKTNYKNNVKTVSCLLHQDHGFKQAPYEEISKEEYQKYSSRVTPITGSEDDLPLDDQERTLVDSQECATGACPIR